LQVAASNSIVPLHTAVAGRARLQIAGLKRSEALKARLETALAGEPGIESVAANPWTGNLLVRHGPQIDLRAIIARLEVAIDSAGAPDATPAAGARAGGRGPSSNGANDAAMVAAGRPRTGEATNGAAPAWHVCTAREVVSELETSRLHGLSEQEAANRLRRFGPNALAPPETRSALAMLVEQFATLPVALLGASAVLSLVTGGVFDAVAIMAVVGVNAAIGFATESHAERTIASLRKLGQPTARVLRDGRRRDIPADRVVPGDVLVLTAGGVVAADARVLAGRELLIDEAVLTGESLPMRKTSEPLRRADVPLADRANMVFKGTAVTSGRGLAIAVGTGADTEIGRVQAMVGTALRPETPMERQLERMGRQLVWLCSGVCGLVFAIGLVRGYGVLPMLKTSVSLAVAAVPEGLPALATSTLALGIGAMRRHRVQIRHLGAVETLGSVQVLCFDKTGTLTMNEMAVVEVATGARRYHLSDGRLTNHGTPVVTTAGADVQRLLELGALCNETELQSEGGKVELHGSPTESALVRLALDHGVDVKALRRRHPLVAMRYRSERRPYVTSVHDGNGERRLIAVKGSPGAVLGMCATYLQDGTRHPLSEAECTRIRQANSQMAGKALRVLGFAFADADDEPGALEHGLTWVGLAGLADPVRGGMRDLMQTLHRAGTRTVMITGDQSATAFAIAKELELSRGREIEILDSERLDKLDPVMLTALAQRAHVFARVSPAHKLQIVQALQRAGKVVAMTGDGVNDSPALKAADIGIAMGGAGTELAREVADVILEDDDLRTMVAAISQGRTIYSNIRKSIHYLLATNLTEIMVTLAATTAGQGQPLSAVQLLWINLVSDVLPAVGLALEPPEPDVLDRPPRDPQEAILGHEDFARIGQEAALIGGGALAAYAYGSLRYGSASPQVGTMTLGSLITSQLLHAITSRSAEHGVFTRARLPANRYLAAGLGASFAAQLAAVLFPPLRNLLGIAPIGAGDAVVTVAGGTLPFVVLEALKAGREPPPRRADERATGAGEEQPGASPTAGGAA